jgi:hypothetical protein
VSDPTGEAVLNLREKWRLRLAEVQAVYEQKPTQENYAEWSRVLKIFRDLVMDGKEPPPDA